MEEVKTETPPATESTQLVTLRPPAAALKKYEDLEMASERALAKLKDLATGATLTEAVRAQVQALVGRVNPNMKGLSEDVVVDWQLPEILVAQPTSTFGDSRPTEGPGAIGNGALVVIAGRKSILATLNRPFKFRVLFEYSSNIKFIQGEKAPQCQSPDAKLGSPQGECSKCPDLPMGRQPGSWDDQKHSECAYNLCYVVIDSEFSNVYEIKFSKTSLKAGKALATAIRASSVGVWEREFLLDTEKKSNEHGTYFIFKTAPTGQATIDPEHHAVCDALYDVYDSNRAKALHRWYGGVLNAKTKAAEGESTFNTAGLAAGIGGDGEEPEGIGEIPATASKPDDKKPDDKKKDDKKKDDKGARKSNVPM